MEATTLSLSCVITGTAVPEGKESLVLQSIMGHLRQDGDHGR